MNTMINRRLQSLGMQWLGVGLLFSAPVLAQNAPINLLPEGNFETVAANKPAGWDLLNPDRITIGEAGGNRWIKLSSPAVGESAIVQKMVKLPANHKVAVVSARMKVSGLKLNPDVDWNEARIAMRFTNDKGEQVGGYPSMPALRENTDWTTKEVVLDVPDGATQLQLQPGLWGVAGVLELDDVRVVTYPDRRAYVRRDILPLRASLPEGKFDDVKLTGWSVRDRERIQVVDAAGNKVLRVTNPNDNSNQTTQITFDLPKDWAGVVLKTRMRIQDIKLGPETAWHPNRWRQGGVHVAFLDDEGREMNQGFGAFAHQNTDWKEFTANGGVPLGATAIRLTAGIFHASGTVELDDISLEGQSSIPLVNAEVPKGEKLWWGEEPIEVQSSKRAQILLNGLWRFVPAVGETAQDPKGGWGLIRVPGTWKEGGGLPGVVAPGGGRMWLSFDGDKVNEAWYEREINIPADWAGRAIEVDLSRVSTDAVVYANGVKCGEVRWPMGTVDITKAVKPGKNMLRIWVLATNNGQEVLSSTHSMTQGLARGQVNVGTKGIIGDVVLKSRPQNAHVSDVFVQPSTRKNNITLDVELTGVQKAGTVQLIAKMLNEKGVEEKRFTSSVKVQKAGTQTARISWPWAGARLWDVSKPNLYTLRLETKGAGLDDEYGQEFGFREFWIEGRKIFLNNHEIRLRTETAPISGIVEENEGKMDGMLWAGFNFVENWPTDVDERGSVSWDDLWARSANHKGFLSSTRLPHIGSYLIGDGWTFVGDQNNNLERWAQRARMIIRRQRNHPSVVMWNHSANFFATGDDQNPRVLGHISRPATLPNDTGGKARFYGVLANNLIKKYDPSRPVMTHAGSSISDIYSVNNYLNMIPLQEREEWLSQWAKTGDIPFMAVEFGTPLFTSLLRGRDHYGSILGSEPWQTEFSAIYFGNDAYKNEPASYRQDIAKRFQGGQNYGFNWTYDRPGQIYNPAMQKLQTLFVRNTWRSWRTMGVTAGLVPWEKHGWQFPIDWGHTSLKNDLGDFQPGRRGVYSRSILKRDSDEYLKPQKDGVTVHESGWELMNNNRDTLAWIAGPAPRADDVAAFTAKDHSFKPGDAVEKSFVLINDARSPQPYSAQWTVTLGGKQIVAGNKSGTLAVSQTLHLPLTFNAPTITDDKADGEIKLNATIGNVKHEDSFNFRIVTAPAPVRSTVVAFDPLGKTTAMLRAMGVTVTPWTGAATDSLLVIGREALSGGHKLPGDLQAFVNNGGRAIVFAQNPNWMRENLGLRTAEHVARRVFPVASTHPVVQGLDAEDLRDWTGHSTLVEAKPHQPGEPRFGWHWGNRGAVSSAPIEKPHLSSWRPILETEFDLQYTPLMEMEFGRGRLILNTLDLEDHVGQDVAAARIATNLLNYAQTAPLTPKAQTVLYIGDDNGAKLLDSLGVNYQRAGQLDPKAQLVIVSDAANAASITAYLQAGGRVLVLPQSTASQLKLGAQNISIGEVKDYGGASEVPNWPEARGLSLSDLHYKVPKTSLLVTTGGEVGSGGQFARVQVGNGLAVVSQTNPNAFDADKQTYYRFTRWRQTRALTQLLSNLGASFKSDTRFFHPEPERLWINVEWRIKGTNLTTPVGQERTKDTGISDAAKAALAPEFNDSAWDKIEMPRFWEPLEKMNGEVVVRREINIPADWAGKDLVVSLGRIDDFDDTYFNGVEIGVTHDWFPDREYTIPGNLVKAGKNVIAVRVFDDFGGGGFGGQADQMFIRRKVSNAVPFYHSDYRADFKHGDNPYRYFRW